MLKRLENASFFLALALITVLFFTLLKPFFSAVLWACVLALLFYPLQVWLVRHWKHHNLAALATLAVCICIGIIPALFLIMSFFGEGAHLYQQLQTGQLNPAVWLDRIHHSFPAIQDFLAEFNVDLASLNQQVSGSAVSASRFLAQHAVKVGQGTLRFFVSLGLMLYLLFFLLRDGPALIKLLKRALPLGDEREQLLMQKFAEVTRATVKGNLLVALVQGALGGLVFWFLGIPNPLLWGIIMVFLSMIPVVGAGLIWIPVAIYLFITNQWIDGTILAVFGVCIIGLVDNVLRPLLVSRDTKMPDYMILFSTLGGLSLFGLNGFVVGPLVAALFMSFWGIFARDFNTEDAKNEDGEHQDADRKNVQHQENTEPT